MAQAEAHRAHQPGNGDRAVQRRRPGDPAGPGAVGLEPEDRGAIGLGEIVVHHQQLVDGQPPQRMDRERSALRDVAGARGRLEPVPGHGRVETSIGGGGHPGGVSVERSGASRR